MMLPVTDTTSLPITLSSSFYFAGEKVNRRDLACRLPRGFFFESVAVFNSLDLLPLGAFFGQPCRRGSPSPEHKHNHSKEKHDRAPPQVYIQWLRRAQRHDEADDNKENTEHGK